MKHLWLMFSLCAFLSSCKEVPGKESGRKPEIDCRYLLNGTIPVRFAAFLERCSLDPDIVRNLWGSDSTERNSRQCIQRMDVQVDGKKVVLLSSAYRDIANLKTVYFFMTSGDIKFVLSGGDAGTSYNATYTIKKLGARYFLTRREIHHGEFPGYSEYADYRPSLICGKVKVAGEQVAPMNFKKNESGVLVEVKSTRHRSAGSGNRISKFHVAIDGMECLVNYSSVGGMTDPTVLGIKREGEQVIIGVGGSICGVGVVTDIVFKKERRRCVLEKAVARHKGDVVYKMIYKRVSEEWQEKM